MKLDSIAYRIKMECTSVKRSLDFLINNGLVEKTMLSGKREVYAISERGLSVFRTLRTLRQLEELKKTLPAAAAEQTSEEATILTEHTRKQK
jgi:predicted transcriptional regulator